MVLTAERLQETLQDAVRRGRITPDDAEQLRQSLVSIGRQQTDDVIADVERLLSAGPAGARRAAVDASARARSRVESTASRAVRSESADRVLREVDRARRAVGVGPSFPVMGYDELSASQVSSRLDSLTPAQLRKVRDYERRNQSRKSVLSAIERKLA